MTSADFNSSNVDHSPREPLLETSVAHWTTGDLTHRRGNNRLSQLVATLNLSRKDQTEIESMPILAESIDAQNDRYQQAISHIGMSSILNVDQTTPKSADKLKYYLISCISRLMLRVIRLINSWIAPPPNPESEADALRTFEGRLINGGDFYKTATKEYDDKDGNVYAKQSLFREDAKKHHLEMMQSLTNRLEAQRQTLVESNGSDEEMAAISKQIALCEQEITNAEALSRDFISSNYVRDVLDAKRDLDFSEEVKSICAGAPVNQRYNQVEIAGESVGGHCDLGVIAYHGNSLTNLNELKIMLHNPIKVEEKRAFLLELRERVAARSESEAKSKALQAIDFALDQISSPAKLKEAVDERRFFLSNQFLHLLRTQLEHNIDGIDFSSNDPFTMVQLALLNPHTSNIDMTGWTHDEKNQMLDMREIYNEFNGKDIIFDGSTPYIDNTGAVHMPFNREGQRVTLETIFFNVSVQGYTKNDDIQRRVNESAIEKLLIRSSQLLAKSCSEDGKPDPVLMEANALLQDVNRRLNAGESSYKLAEDLGYALTRMKIAMAVNCLSAKDRTGYVSTRIILRHVISRLDELLAEGVIDERKYQQLKEAFEVSITSPDSCPAKNIYENTGTSVLKCSAYHLPGYSDAKCGDARRLYYYILQGALIIETKVEKAKLLNERRWEHLRSGGLAAQAA